MTSLVTSLRASRRARSLGAPLAALVVAALALTACGPDRNTPGPTKTVTEGAAASSGGSSAAASSSATTPKPKPKPKGAPVKVSSFVIGDGSQVGVGLPIILLLSRQIKDATQFAKATKVTVNGNEVHGAWYFERKYSDPGHPVEADYRLQTYWPGHARIRVEMPIKGKSAGPGLVFANSLSLNYTTGAANILTVDNATHKLTVMSDGKQWGTFPVSLGAANTPTKRGTKVIMEKGASICMHGPGYDECGIKFTQRLTYDGEYLHAAPWNIAHIESGFNSSNGCTNLLPNDAEKLYNFLEIGDVVQYPNADGPRMQLGDGYGDWNLSWGQWKTGGLYQTT